MCVVTLGCVSMSLFNRLLGTPASHDQETEYHRYATYPPARVNVDDLRNVHEALFGLRPDVKLASGQADVDGMSQLRDRSSVADLINVHPVELQHLAMSVSNNSDEGDEAGTWSIDVDIQPAGRQLSLNQRSSDGEVVSSAATAYDTISQIFSSGRRSWVDPNQGGRAADLVAKLAVAVALIWFLLSAPGWPLAVFGIVVGWLVWRIPVKQEATRWFEVHAPKSWFDATSRAQLAADRSNRRANLRVALISGPIGAAIGAIAVTLLTNPPK